MRRQAQRDGAFDWAVRTVDLPLIQASIQSGVALRLPPHSKLAV